LAAACFSIAVERPIKYRSPNFPSTTPRPDAHLGEDCESASPARTPLSEPAMVRSRKRKSKQRCVYCGGDGPLTIDHVVPISRWREFGVKRRVLDNKSNRVIACVRCNAEKGAMSPREWFDLHPEYKERFMREARYLSDTVRKIAGIE